MRISVALCTYHGATFLGAQLASLASQTRPPDELVLCDDASTDDTVAIARRFAATCAFRVTIVENPHNLRSTRNFAQAIALCEGDVIVTADQDDVWYPAKLATIERALHDATDAGLVFSDADLIDGQGQPIGVRLWESVRFRRASHMTRGDAFGTLLRRPAVTGATMAFRRDLRPIFEPIPASWVHDEWIALMIASRASLLPIPQPLMQYRKHPGNQEGVAGVTLAERTRGTLRRPREVFAARALAFDELADRLRDHPAMRRLAEEKAAHLRARAALPASPILRIPGVMRELVRLRYARFSGSPLAFARDLIAPG